MGSSNRTGKTGRYSRRSFSAADYGRLADFKEMFSLNSDIQAGLSTVRRRARAIVKNDGYARNIINSYKVNIIGDRGINFSCQAKKPNGQLDEKDNTLVESEFAKWGKFGVCSVDGRHDLVSLENLILETVAVDGECIILFRRGRQFGKYNFQIEVLPADHLDEGYYAKLDNGNDVIQGVEFDSYFKPVGYWLWERNPNDSIERYVSSMRNRIRVDAEDMILLGELTAPRQVRSLSWLIAALVPLHHLNKLSSHELEMARVATLKQVVYKSTPGADFPIGEEEITEGMDVINTELQSGGIEILPPGFDPVSIDWTFPNANTSQLRKDKLREASAASFTSYNTVAKDLESVNYSSYRAGNLEDRVTYANKQRWFINAFLNRVYEEWLKMQLTNGNLPFGIKKLDKFLEVRWTPRGFESPDPLKDGKADTEGLQNRTMTLSEILHKRGVSLDEHINAMISDEKAIKTAFENAGLPYVPLVQPKVSPNVAR